MMTTDAKPLAGVRITDFTMHAAGPYCTHFLALLGAECIKIESSMRPDIHRRPHPVYGRTDISALDQCNANKLGITLNLKEPAGVELAKRLVAVSDVVAESFRPGVLQRLGLDYQRLREVRSDIVMVSISASGQVGPEKAHSGYAPLFAALGGLGYLTGYADAPPVEMRNAMDNVTGLTAAVGVLAALYRRSVTGDGEYVDVAARDVASAFVGDALVVAALTGRNLSRQGNDQPLSAPHGVYECAGEDRWIAISVSSDAQWTALLSLVGSEALLGDIRSSDAVARWNQRRELDRELNRWTRTQDREELTRALQRSGVPAFPSYDAADIIKDVHLRERHVISEWMTPSGEQRPAVGAPWCFSRTPVHLERLNPQLGEHNGYVFRELLGLSDVELQELTAAKIIY
jgi:crotonobetainyl-CoA:carnitine CoA-transferase CaiB-like acyl-CoA transferase